MSQKPISLYREGSYGQAQGNSRNPSPELAAAAHSRYSNTQVGSTNNMGRTLWEK